MMWDLYFPIAKSLPGMKTLIFPLFWCLFWLLYNIWLYNIWCYFHEVEHRKQTEKKEGRTKNRKRKNHKIPEPFMLWSESCFHGSKHHWTSEQTCIIMGFLEHRKQHFFGKCYKVWVPLLLTYLRVSPTEYKGTCFWVNFCIRFQCNFEDTSETCTGKISCDYSAMKGTS